MEIKEINNKQEWEYFLAGCIEKTFLQSWNWGEFQISLGNKTWRFGIFEEGELVMVALVIKISARRGSFLLVPHGPVMKSEIEILRFDALKTLHKKLLETAKSENVDFIRISPIWEKTAENQKLFKNLGVRQAPLHNHPESSWKLNIEPSESEILRGMRKTTRYLVKQAENNKDLKIFYGTDEKGIEIFNKLHLEVVKAQKFIPFSLEYFKKEFSSFLPDGQILILFAEYDKKIIAAAYEIFWSGMAFYHHAALLPEYKKIPASYLLQWEAIKEAKKRNCEIYDFWGYSDPKRNPKHPYSGPTLFKMGFGGHLYEYVKTQDYIITQKYWLNYIIEKIRKIKRGL